MNYLSNNIKFLRQQKGLTQEELGKVVDKTRSLISAWESSDREISTQDIIKLSNYFNVPMDALISKDLKLEQAGSFDELELLFSKTKDILTEDDRDMIRFVIEKRKKEIDKQLDNQ